MEHIDLVALLTIAFIGSIGHCSGMCGGFVLAYTHSKIDPKWQKTYQTLAHLNYNFGRASAYAILGAIFGALGSVLSFSMSAKGFTFAIVGLIMILMGLSFLGKIKFLTRIESSIAETQFFKNSFRKLLENQNLISFYLLGVLNGFIPCGFVYFFLSGAIATSSPFDGALVMFLFGIATIPTLFSIGFISGFLKNIKYRNIVTKISAILIILFGLFTLFKAVMLLNGKMPMKMEMNIKNIVKDIDESNKTHMN